MRIAASLTPASLMFVCIATALSACGDEEQSGTLTVEYRFGPGGSCESLGIEDVRVVIGDDIATEDAPCDDDDKQIVLSNVPSGTRNILVEGVAIAGGEEIRVADNLGNPDTDERVEILGGSSKDFSVTLTPTPATIEFVWEIRTADNLPVAQCQDSPVKTFDVTAFEGASDIISHSFVYCDSAGLDPLPDPDRRIKGTDVDGVIVVPRTSSAALDDIEFTFSPPGPGRTVRMVVRCTGETCIADGDPVVSGTDPEEETDGNADESGG